MSAGGVTRLLAGVVTLLLLGCSGTSRMQAEAAGDPPAAPQEEAQAAPGEPVVYLQSNATRDDGERGFVHVTPDDMPWVISIGTPHQSPRFGSRKQAREVAIEAIRAWETALRAEHPWFQLEFVEDDPEAPVQVKWKRRVVGAAAGWGKITCLPGPHGPRVGGEMQVAVKSDPYSQPLEIDEVRLLIGHEFGHILGLGHCLECDSAMNYSWHTRDRVLVTASDVATFGALVAQPNLCR